MQTYPVPIFRCLLRNIGRSYAKETGVRLRLLVELSPKTTLFFRCEEKQVVPERQHLHDPEGILCEGTSPKPGNIDYYRAVAEMLTGAEEILLIGIGIDSRPAILRLKAFLATNYPGISSKIIGVLTMDDECLTKNQLLEATHKFITLIDTFEHC
jgi:hypothetical protein